MGGAEQPKDEAPKGKPTKSRRDHESWLHGVTPMLAIVAVVACHGPMMTSSVDIASPPTVARTPWRPVLSTTLESQERATLDSAIVALNCLCTDPGFLGQVTKHRGFFGSRSEARKGQYYTGKTISKLLAHVTPSASTIVVGDPYGDGPASTGLDKDGSGTIPINHEHEGLKTTCSSGEIPAQLINTVAHEYMHLYSTPNGRQRFLDSWNGRWRVSAASYQVGNLAQCYMHALTQQDLEGAMAACMSLDKIDGVGNVLASSTADCLPRPSKCDQAAIAAGELGLASGTP